MPVGFQVVFRARNDRVLAPDAAARRAWSSALLDFGGKYGLYGFGLADTHGHAALYCQADSLPGFVHDLRVSLSSRLRLHVSPPTVSEIRDVWHAEAVLGYVHRQDAEHGVGADPLREGTSLPDLLGLRPRGAWLADRVRTWLPRVRRETLLAHWGLDALDPGFDASTLAEAGAAAIGVARLSGRSDTVVAARRACVHAAGGLTTAEIARLLGSSERAVRRLRSEAANARLVQAVRLQMGLRLQIGPVKEPLFVADGAGTGAMVIR